MFSRFECHGVRHGHPLVTAPPLSAGDAHRVRCVMRAHGAVVWETGRDIGRIADTFGKTPPSAGFFRASTQIAHRNAGGCDGLPDTPAPLAIVPPPRGLSTAESQMLDEVLVSLPSLVDNDWLQQLNPIHVSKRQSCHL
jgi:hypothetical protein